MTSIGIALGGGGAKGLAHVAVLETLDQLGIKPVAVAGTSIGSIIGSAYAAGRSGLEIREALDGILSSPRSFEELRESGRMFPWLELLGLEFGKSHVLEAHAFVDQQIRFMKAERFEDLPIPLKVVAADFWNREEVVFDKGELKPAITASFALPGIFKPVQIGDQVLIDGGCVNPVPYDLLMDECDLVIAVDVLGKRVPGEDLMPSYSEAVFNTFQIAESTIIRQKMRHQRPHIFLQPDIRNVKVLDFNKSEQIYAESAPICEELKMSLDKIL